MSTQRPDERTARRARSLFDRAADLRPEERAAFLDREAGGDAVLRREVDALLSADASKGAFLEVSAPARWLGARAAPARLAPGDTVGDFTVVGLLGEGGGGVVYEATQRQPHRTVALKLLAGRARSGDAQRRFLGEAETLARLHHPGIAHVYAAGVHETGAAALPWIAMERVEDAEDVVGSARRRGLGVEQRVRLFLPVCEALQHAHGKGVVHRDVKPGNVLVNSSGRTRLVDFGIALGSGSDGPGARDVVGTVAYMSPEQLEPGGAGTDVRGDVYGLGVLLFELLAEALPHDVEGLSPEEAARRKREVAPAPLRGRVPADLESIVLRALAPDRERRYPSAASMAEDLSRWLALEPVAAHGGGALYHVGKFVRRRRGVAAAAAAAILAAAGGTVASLRAAAESERAREDAERHAYLANVAAAAAALRVHDAAEARRRLDRCPAPRRDWEWRHLRSRVDLSSATVAWAGRSILDGACGGDGRLVAAIGTRRASGGLVVVDLGIWRADGTLVREGEIGVHEPARAPSAVALSQNSSLLAVAHRDGRLVLVDAATGESPRLVQCGPSPLIDVAFSPRGDLVATGSADGVVRLIDVRDATLVRALGGPGDRVISTAFTADGARVVAGGRDGVVRVWDVATGAEFAKFAGHESSVEGVAPSPDGTRLATVSRDRTVRLWDFATGTEIARRPGHRSNVRGVAFAPDGRTFASASWDGTLRVWDAATGDETAVLRGHEGMVTAVAFIGGEAPVVSFSRDGTWRRWDPRLAATPALRGLPDRVEALAVAPGGECAAARLRDGATWLFSVRDPARRRALDEQGALNHVAFLGPDELLGVRRTDGLPAIWGLPAVRRWDGGPGDAAPAESHVLPGPAVATFLAVAPGRRDGWTVNQLGTHQEPEAEFVRIDFDREGTGRSVRLPETVTAFAWDPATDRLAAGTFEGKVVTWSAADPSARRERSVHEGRVNGLSFSPEGSTLLTAGSDGRACVLRASDLSELARLEGHSDVVSAALFLPGATRVATCSADRTVRLWDPATGDLVLTLHDADDALNCLAVTPDGTTLLAGSGTVEDARSGVVLWTAPAR